MIFFSSFFSLVKSLLKIKKQSRKKVGMNNPGCWNINLILCNNKSIWI